MWRSLTRFWKSVIFNGLLQPNLWSSGKTFLRLICTNSSSTGMCIPLSRKINSLAQHLGNVFVLRKKWLFEICQYFHIFTYMILMNNINLFNLRCPYFIFYIDRNKIHRELCSIFEIRIMLKRCLSPLKLFVLWWQEVYKK